LQEGADAVEEEHNVEEGQPVERDNYKSMQTQNFSGHRMIVCILEFQIFITILHDLLEDLFINHKKLIKFILI